MRATDPGGRASVAGSGLGGSGGAHVDAGGVGGVAHGGNANAGAGGVSSGATAGATGAGKSGAAPNGGTAGGNAGDAEAGAGPAGTGDVGGGLAGTGGAACVPKREVCDGVSNDCDDAVDEDGVCPLGCSGQTREGHVYVLCLFPDSTQELDYDHATTWCKNAGPALGLGTTLELARVESRAENDFIKSWIEAQATVSGMVWFGANDIDEEGRWVWGRGADATQFFVGSSQGGGMPYMNCFNDFEGGRPNSVNGEDEDCGAFDSDFSWDWNALVCRVPRLGFVCEQTP